MLARSHKPAPTHHKPAHSPPVRPAFTFAEVLVALVILTAGLLALVSTSAVLVQEVGAAHAREAATLTALSRIERLQATSCALLGSASAPTLPAVGPGATESWTATPLASGVVALSDSVWYSERGRGHLVALQALVSC